MQKMNEIEILIKQKNLTKKYVYEKLGYSASGFDKAIKLNSFKTDALLRLAEILELEPTYFIDNEDKYKHLHKSVVEENTKVYGKIEIDDLLIKIISRLDKIVDLLENK